MAEVFEGYKSIRKVLSIYLKIKMQQAASKVRWKHFGLKK